MMNNLAYVDGNLANEQMANYYQTEMIAQDGINSLVG